MVKFLALIVASVLAGALMRLRRCFFTYGALNSRGRARWKNRRPARTPPNYSGHGRKARQDLINTARRSRIRLMIEKHWRKVPSSRVGRIVIQLSWISQLQ